MGWPCAQRNRKLRENICCAPPRASLPKATFSTGGILHLAEVVRTRISDDLLWLPYAVINFVETTGEIALLDEVVPSCRETRWPTARNESYFQTASVGSSRDAV